MKCLQQIERLRSAIETGELGPGEMVGTEFAFSQEWGFSRNTVRRGIETLVSAGLLERRPGKGLYVRSPHSTTRSVQVLIPNLAWAHLFKFARGVQAAARTCGVHALLYDSQGQVEHALEAMRRLPEGAFEGAIIVSLHDKRFSEFLFELKAADYPFVLVDQRLHDLETATVEISNYEGGYLVGQKLAEHGHRRVIFLGPLHLQVITERLSGFRDAMLDNRQIFDRSLVVDLGGEGVTEWMNEKISATEETVLALLSRADRPTAIFDGSGDAAPYIYRSAKKLGLSIPEDLSVVSFDDSPLNHFLEPEVSRLHHAWNDVGHIALAMLLEQMQGFKRRGGQVFEHRVMDFEWVSGGSLAQARHVSGEG